MLRKASGLESCPPKAFSASHYRSSLIRFYHDHGCHDASCDEDDKDKGHDDTDGDDGDGDDDDNDDDGYS